MSRLLPLGPVGMTGLCAPPHCILTASVLICDVTPWPHLNLLEQGYGVCFSEVSSRVCALVSWLCDLGLVTVDACLTLFTCGKITLMIFWPYIFAGELCDEKQIDTLETGATMTTLRDVEMHDSLSHPPPTRSLCHSPNSIWGAISSRDYRVIFFS
jgi:hypothetical protein